jgi:hypothetical protein
VATAYRVPPGYDVGTLTQEGAKEQRHIPTEFGARVDGDRQGPNAVACGGARTKDTPISTSL